MRCADEGQQCAFAGLKMVRYGAAGQFRLGTFTDGVGCSDAAFGDPIASTPKACWTYNTAGEVTEEQARAASQQRLQSLTEEIGHLYARIRHRDQQLDELNAGLASRDEHLRQLDEQLRQRDERISQLEAQLQNRERRPSARGLRERMRERGLGPFPD